jgi:hypothetical protein
VSGAPGFTAGIAPGRKAADIPVERYGEPIRLVDCFGPALTGLYFANPDGSLGRADADALAELPELGMKPVVILPPFCPFVGEAVHGRVLDQSGEAHERYDALPGTFYLIDGSGRVVGRWRRLQPAEVQRLLAKT